MSMQIKQSIDLNSIIKGVHDLIIYMECNIGDLNEEKQPIIGVIYDTLIYIGLPANAIQLAIGNYSRPFLGDELSSFWNLDFDGNIRPDSHCDFCYSPAIYLAPTPAGDRLACKNHMKLITDKLIEEGILANN